MTMTNEETAAYAKGWEDARLALAVKYEEELTALREVFKATDALFDGPAEYAAPNETNYVFSDAELDALFRALDAVRKAGAK